MKLLFALSLVVLLTACDSNSSPEGRMTNKMEEVRREFDTLKLQNERILDSLGEINERLQRLEAGK
jgi:hypothetical protein